MADVTVTMALDATQLNEGIKQSEAKVEQFKKRLASAGAPGSVPFDAVAAGGVKGTTAIGGLKPNAAGASVPSGTAHPWWGRLGGGAVSQLGIPKGGATAEEGGLSAGQIGGMVGSAALLIGSMVKVTEAINQSRTAMAQLQQAAANYWSGQAEAVATGGGAQMLSMIGQTSVKLRELHQELQLIGMKSKLGQFKNFMMELVGGEGDTGKRQSIAMQQFMGQSQMLVALDRYNELARQAATIEQMRADGLGDQADQLEFAIKRGQERLALELAIQKAGASKEEKEQMLGEFDARTDTSLRNMRAAVEKKAKTEWEQQAAKDTEDFEKDKQKTIEEFENDKKKKAEIKAAAEAKGMELLNREYEKAEKDYQEAKDRTALDDMAKGTAPSVVASSKAEVGLGGGTFTFGGSDPTERLVQALDRNTEVVQRLAPATNNPNFNHKP